jgi:hypothetical protein
MSALDVKQAVTLAKDYVTTLFADEGLNNLGLEEVEFDDAHDHWHITLGFSRSWDRGTALGGLVVATTPRSYKVVTIDHSGKILSVKNRETANAG